MLHRRHCRRRDLYRRRHRRCCRCRDQPPLGVVITVFSLNGILHDKERKHVQNNKWGGSSRGKVIGVMISSAEFGNFMFSLRLLQLAVSFNFGMVCEIHIHACIRQALKRSRRGASGVPLGSHVVVPVGRLFL